MQNNNKSSYTEAKEIGFNLPLPMFVEGKDVYGKKFHEKTMLSYISHNGSSFWLSSSVPLGSDLKLIIDMPPKLADKKDLKLIIKGNVIFIESSEKQNCKQRISLKFKNKYVIDTEDKTKT